jgi:hypothetical protein
MKRIATLIAAAAVLLSACGESKLPEPTGKGSIRAINAIPASPSIAFLIERRNIATADYKGATAAARYDDFLYNFNFEVLYPGDTARTNIATQPLQVVANRDYVLVVGGTLDNATITVWEGDERTWAGDETDFELRFGHAAGAFGDADVYFVPQNDVAGPNNLAATLAFGEASAASDVAEGDYTILVTAAGDINDVLFQSEEITFGAQNALLITLFDGDENDLSSMAVRSVLPSGNVVALADANTLPTLRFIHASTDLGPVDIYDDALLANRIVANQAFGGVSGDIPGPVGDTSITITPPDDTGVLLIERDYTAIAGTFATMYLVGQAGNHSAVAQSGERRSISVQARFRLFHASSNHPTVDVYVVEPDALIDEEGPDRFALPFAFDSGYLSLLAGDYDVYITTSGEKTVLDGPFRLTVALGDVVEALILDRVATPDTVEIRLIQDP